MRKRIWIPLVVILGICLLLLVKLKQPRQSALPEQSQASTNQAAQPEQSKTAENFKPPTAPMTKTVPPSAEPPASELSSNAVWERTLARWQAPIEFYGKVVDENTNPVADAMASFHWVEAPTADGNRSTNIKSDSGGLFSLHDALGLTLAVSVGKEGYYSSRRDNDSFSYGSVAVGHFSPDSQNPVIFHLRKKSQGVELLTSQNGMRPDVWVRVSKDNTPVRVDFFQKQASATGQLEIRQNKPPWQGATNWSFRLSIPDGGLVENQDEFQFTAPDTGYQPTVEYHFAKGETDWTTQVAKQFYIAFGQPRKYGWLRIESNLAQETVFLTYAINPTGSRNLEPQ